MSAPCAPAPPWAIVPVKTLAQAKQRLAGVLPPEARRRLMLVMLGDVLATLAAVATLGPVVVVTPDAQVATLAQSCGAHVLREVQAEGHSAAVMAGLVHAAAHGAWCALTVPADAPLVTPAEVARLIDAVGTGPGAHLVLAPSHDRDGTNAIVATPPDVFPPHFGPGSFARHLAAAEAMGLACRAVELAGLGMDVDEPHDLAALLARKRDDPNYAFLQERGGPRGPILATSIEAPRS
jgi:2-phospho-L-lactate/phosphoenolpyruvate guanylyltransferase